MLEFIDRDIAYGIEKLASWFPVVSITGPRQSGKSTLSKKLFPEHEYVNLELPGVRQQALDDPVGFIRSHSPKLVVDEAQYAPALFSAIQAEVDLRDEPGQYVITGSQSFALQRQITQSLAGRVGQATLLPLSFGEAKLESAFEFAVKGGYPRLYKQSIPAKTFYANYVSTYLERDIAGQVHARNLSTFRSFIKACADNAGGLLNVSGLASDLGINTRTAKSWLSLLEGSYLVFKLQPWSTNARKRLIKTPKLYFYDTGLLCHLLGVRTSAELEVSSYKGAVFENLVIAETAKRHLNQIEQPELYFYRDRASNEAVDLIDMTDIAAPELFEIKSSQTYKSSYMAAVSNVEGDFKAPGLRSGVVMRSDVTTKVGEHMVWKAEDWLRR